MGMYSKYTDVEPYRASVQAEVNSHVETEIYELDENQNYASETRPDVQTEQEKEVPESLPNQPLQVVKLNQVVIDDSYRGRVTVFPDLIDQYAEVCLAGRAMPPIKLERDTNKLVDGYHRYSARINITERLKRGELTKQDCSKMVIDIDFIEVEFVDVPVDVEPRLMSLSYNMSHGRRASMDDIKAAVRKQFENRPGYKAKELAAFLGVSEDTARRYADEILKERKAKIEAFVLQQYKEGNKQKEIEKRLKEEFPGVSGTSQATISKILSENRKVSKTDKTNCKKNETDLACSHTDNIGVDVDEEDQENLDSVLTNSDSGSSISEASAVPSVIKNSNFDICMNALDEVEHTIISKIKFLSSSDVDVILKKIDSLAINIENKARKLKLID